MKPRLAIIAPLLSNLITPPSFAEAGWTGYAQISELTSTSQPYFLVTLEATENPSGCKNKRVYYCDITSVGSEQMFRVLLEAIARRRMVRLYVTGNCELNGYSEISSVSIIP